MKIPPICFFLCFEMGWGHFLLLISLDMIGEGGVAHYALA